MPMSAEFNSIILAFGAGYCYRERSIQVGADMFYYYYYYYYFNFNFYVCVATSAFGH
jgi:hypothetical protein